MLRMLQAVSVELYFAQLCQRVTALSGTLVEISSLLGKYCLCQAELERALAELERGQQISYEHNVRNPPAITLLRNGLAEAYLLTAEQSDKTERAEWLKKARRAYQAALKYGGDEVAGQV